MTLDFRVLFESAPGLFLVLRPNFHIVAASDAYLEATLTTRPEIIGRDIFDVFPDNPADREATGVRNLRASLDRVLKSRRPDAMPIQKYDVRRPKSEGGAFEERYWSPLNSPVLDADGKVTYIIHRVEDVTEFVRLKEADKKRKETTEVLAVRAEQMEAEIFLRAQEVAEANQRLRTANNELALLYRQIASLMTQVYSEFRDAQPQPDDRHSVQHPIAPEEMLASVSRLIGQHKQMEEHLRHSQKMEAVGRLAGGVAHDFNNLLTVIGGYAALIQDRQSIDPLPPELDEIVRATDRAAALTKKLLALGRKQVLQPRVIDLNTVIAGIEDLLRRLIGESISLVTVLASGLGRLKADPSQLEQVILNLAVNARDAMPAGGRLVIETKMVELGSDGIRGLEPGQYVMLSVTDTGHGMDSETTKRIFEPFFTTKEVGKGTGLGLAMVQGIVEQTGGAIAVQSIPGRGATFRVYLPETSEPPESPSSDYHRPASAISASATILLVEDEAPLRRLLSDVLSTAGHRVLEAADGEEGLKLGLRHPGQIDLLLTDIVMPGMSGPDLVNQLLQSRPRLRVLYMSGYDRKLLGHDLLEGASFFPKPFTPQSLLLCVAEVLGSQAPQTGPERSLAS